MSISIDAINIRLNPDLMARACLDIAQANPLESMRFIV
jgi:hypothetical protein